MRPERAYLLDILISCRSIATFVAGVTETEFLSDLMRQGALLYQLIIVGEATKNLSNESRDAHPEVAWRDIAGMRDVFVHAYHRLSLPTVWTIATTNVPALEAFVASILDELADPHS